MPERKQKTVLVDIAGVLADFDKKAEARIIEMHPSITLIKNRKQFHLYDEYPPEYKESFEKISREQGFYQSLEITEGAIDGLNQIIKLGFEPVICSSPVINSEFCIPEKLTWVETMINPFLINNFEIKVIIDKDKYLYDGIALIDDKPIVNNSHLAKWEHIVFDRSYNKDADKLRLMGWDDDNLSDLLMQAEQRYHNLKQFN